jgi:hypothetical protein
VPPDDTVDTQEARAKLREILAKVHDLGREIQQALGTIEKTTGQSALQFAEMQNDVHSGREAPQTPGDFRELAEASNEEMFRRTRGLSGLLETQLGLLETQLGAAVDTANVLSTTIAADHRHWRRFSQLCTSTAQTEGRGDVPTLSKDPKSSLIISAVQARQLTEIELDGVVIPLTNSSFFIALSLCKGRLLETWLHKVDLGARKGEGWQGMTRLHKEIRKHTSKEVLFAENNRAGAYRMHGNIEINGIECTNLDLHSEPRIKQLGSEIRQLLKKLGLSK